MTLTKLNNCYRDNVYKNKKENNNNKYLENLHIYYLSFQRYDNPPINQIGFKDILLDMVAHTFNPSTEAEAGISLCDRGQIGLQNECQNSQRYIKTLLNIWPLYTHKRITDSSECILVPNPLLMQLFPLIFWGYNLRQPEIFL